MELFHAQAERKIGRWLERDQSRIRAIARAFQFDRVENHSLPMERILTVFDDASYIDFINHYEKVGSNFTALCESSYYRHLEVRFHERPYKYEKITAKFPDLAPDGAFEAWLRDRFGRFIRLYENMKRDRWVFDQPGKRPEAPIFQSYLSFIKPPLDDESLNIVFKKIHRERIVAGTQEPLKLIDGHHRIACWHALGGETAPCGVYFLKPSNSNDDSNT